MWGYGPGSGMMGSWGGGWMPFGGISSLVILILVVAAVVWIVRSMARPGEQGRRSSGLDVLEERYARGEIERDEYLRRRRDVLG